ncbi:sporulation delaying protein family toxin [Rhodococcus sp. WS4]|nr:sporulation delaying protein family toxin [Rhodococcus sp. WS4]
MCISSPCPFRSKTIGEESLFTRTSRRAAIAGAAAVALVPITATIATAEEDDTTTTTTSQVHAVEDGRTTYRGLFFGQGPVAQRLVGDEDFGKLAEGLESNSTPEAFDAADSFMTAIDSKNPGFFDAFNSDVHSGDPKRIDAALTDGAAKLEQAGVSVEQREVSPDCGVTVFVGAAVVHVAAAVTAAGAAVTVTLAVGANLVYAQNWFWGSDSAATSSLSQEEAVADLARTLAA